MSETLIQNFGAGNINLLNLPSVRVVVVENPYAKTLPADLFNGSFDERWRYTFARVFAGSKLKKIRGAQKVTPKRIPMTKNQNSKQYDLEERTFRFAQRVGEFVKKLPKAVDEVLSI